MQEILFLKKFISGRNNKDNLGYTSYDIPRKKRLTGLCFEINLFNIKPSKKKKAPEKRFLGDDQPEKKKEKKEHDG